MRQAKVFVQDRDAGLLIENDEAPRYVFEYLEDYRGPPVSLTLPTRQRRHEFGSFPSFFDGLLPEGPQLEALLKQAKLDRRDYFGQLVTVGTDLVGAVTVKELK
ncbi:MAG TPA: HipA N-terminal domain-containing protein [bacterium]|nr:HipA N-terminal domain-containing protein [bacterium]